MLPGKGEKPVAGLFVSPSGKPDALKRLRTWGRDASGGCARGTLFPLPAPSPDARLELVVLDVDGQRGAVGADEARDGADSILGLARHAHGVHVVAALLRDADGCDGHREAQRVGVLEEDDEAAACTQKEAV